MKTLRFTARARAGHDRRTSRGFTLVEVLVAATLCLLVTSMALPAFVSGLVLSAKSMSTTKVTDDLRLSAEHMAAQLGISIRTPVLSEFGSTGTQAARVTYRSSVGIPGQALATSKLSHTLKVSVDETSYPKVGDFVTVSGLNLGDGLVIIDVDDNRTGAATPPSGNVVITLTFADSIQSGVTGTATDIQSGQSVSIFRDSAYAVISVAGEAQLAWYKQASSATPTQIIARRLAASSATPFTLVDGQLNFELVAENTGNVPAGAVNGQRQAYTRAGLKGQLMSKSGNPFALVATPAKTPPTVTTPPKAITPVVTTPPVTTTPAVTKPATTTKPPVVNMDIAADF